MSLGHSLEHLKHALELDPNLLEALFNRALVHYYQGLYQEAEADWRTYLNKDSSSQWAADARERLQSLENDKTRRSENSGNIREPFVRAYHAGDDTAAWEIYRRSHLSNGNDVTKALINSFLAEDNGSNSSENLQALNYLGQLEMRRTEDAYTSDLAQVYASMTPQTRALILEARQQVVKGHELFMQSEIEDATELFASARTTFEKVGNVPESLAAGVAMAQGAALQPELVKGQKLLESIIPDCESKRYKWLLAQALTNSAHINSNLNNYSEAFRDANGALQIFRKLNDLNGMVRAFIQLASLYLF